MRNLRFVSSVIRPVLRSLEPVAGPLIGLGVVLAFFIPLVYRYGEWSRFTRPENLQGLLHTYTVAGVISLGMLMIIVSGGIDLSVGSVVALVTVTTMLTYNWAEDRGGAVWSASIVAIVVGVGVGGACGLVNGVLTTQTRVSPFVATLGMMSVAKGVAYWLTNGQNLPFASSAPSWINHLSEPIVRFIPIDYSTATWIVLAVLVAIVLRYTVFGRYCYALGSSEATARLCGVSVSSNRIAIYTMAGLLTGWAGVLKFADTYSGDPHLGPGLELEVIAAVVIGGARLSGGQGTVVGTLLGVMILAVLENGVSFVTNVLHLKFLLIGIAIVVNTALSGWRQRK